MRREKREERREGPAKRSVTCLLCHSNRLSAWIVPKKGGRKKRGKEDRPVAEFERLL